MSFADSDSSILEPILPANLQLQTLLFNEGSDVLLKIIDQLVGAQGSFNVRMPSVHGITDVRHQPYPGLLAKRKLLRPFIYDAKQPCWKEISAEAHTGFSDLLNFMLTYQVAYEVGVKILYTHPVFVFDHLETAVTFFSRLPLLQRNTVSALKLAVPYSRAVPCICPWLGHYFEGLDFERAQSFVEDTIAVYPHNEGTLYPGHLDMGDGDMRRADELVVESKRGNEPWSHLSDPNELDELLHALPGLLALYLEENPSILAPVILGDVSDVKWLEQIRRERQAVRRTCTRIQHKFGPQLSVKLREYFPWEAVDKWLECGMDMGTVDRYLGGLPVVNDGHWMFW